MRRRTSRVSMPPSKDNVPEVGRSTVASARIKVVLPAPLGPSRPWTPRPMVRVTPSTAMRRRPTRTSRSRASISQTNVVGAVIGWPPDA